MTNHSLPQNLSYLFMLFAQLKLKFYGSSPYEGQWRPLPDLRDQYDLGESVWRVCVNWHTQSAANERHGNQSLHCFSADPDGWTL